MTTTTPAKRPVVGWLIALAGLLAGLAILLVHVAPSFDGTWLNIAVDVALALAFLFLVLGRSAPLVLRIVFAVATVGWAILVVAEFVSLGVVLTIGIWLALAGSLIAGVLVVTRLLFSNVASLLFLLATIGIAVVLLNLVVGPFLSGTIGVVVSVLYALLMLLAGVMIALRK